MVVRQEPLYLVYINLGHKFSVIYTCNYLFLHLDSKGFVHNKFYNLFLHLFLDSAFTYQLAAVGVYGLVTNFGSIKDESYNNIVCQRYLTIYTVILYLYYYNLDVVKFILTDLQLIAFQRLLTLRQIYFMLRQ